MTLLKLIKIDKIVSVESIKLLHELKLREVLTDIKLIWYHDIHTQKKFS